MDNNRSAQILAHLVEEHHAMLYRYAYRLSRSAVDADDLTQQTYLVAQTKLDQLRDESKARGWLCTILRNLFLKDRKEVQKLPLVSLGDVSAVDESPEDEWEISTQLLQESLAELPEDFRTPLILYYFNEMSYRDIAEVMDVPLGTVMSRLSRGKKLLRKKLQVEKQALTNIIE